MNLFSVAVSIAEFAVSLYLAGLVLLIGISFTESDEVLDKAEEIIIGKGTPVVWWALGLAIVLLGLSK